MSIETHNSTWELLGGKSLEENGKGRQGSNLKIYIINLF